MADDSPDVRIGTAERERAFSLLSEHFAAGRLGSSEFDERSAAVSAAVTRGELVPLFRDLPGGSAMLHADQPMSPDSSPAIASSGHVPAVSGGRDYRAVAMGIMPLAALVLFFVTGSWLWFLAVPAAGAILYAGRKDDS